jgi:hypothetical protein
VRIQTLDNFSRSAFGLTDMHDWRRAKGAKSTFGRVTTFF